jgi:hypothetical protein
MHEWTTHSLLFVSQEGGLEQKHGMESGAKPDFGAWFSK